MCRFGWVRGKGKEGKFLFIMRGGGFGGEVGREDRKRRGKKI